MELTPAQEAQARNMMAFYPYRIIYVATKHGEDDVVSAVTSMRIPNKLARDGWTVAIVKG